MTYLDCLDKLNIMFKFPVFLFFLCNLSFSQDLKKEVIYLKYQIDKNCERKMKFFKKDENGIVFNLKCKKNGTVLYSVNHKSDTLPIRRIKEYKISSLDEVSIIEDEWRKKSKPKLIEKYGFPYPIYDKNGIFNTYLIEILKDKNEFVVYPVSWRNLGQKK